MIPEDFNYIGRSRLAKKKCKYPNCDCDPDGHVVIENGKLLQGVMDKSSLGEGQGLMLRNINKKYGEDLAVDIMGKFFRLGLSFLMKRGFTNIISDTDMPAVAKQRLQDVFIKGDIEVKKLIDAYFSNQLESLPGKTLVETYK